MSIKKTKYSIQDLEKEIGGLTFAKLLEANRRAQEYSQKKFAKLLGISPSSLCDLEKGRKIPTPSRAAKIAKQLRLSQELWIQVALQDQLCRDNLKYKVILKKAS